MPRDERATWCGLPVTSARRTLLDCLHLLPTHEAADLFEWGLRRRIVTVEDLRGAVLVRCGERGIGTLRRVLDQCGDNSWSPAERRLHRVLRTADIRGRRANAEIRDDRGLVGIGDVVFEAARLVLEVDGRAAHAGGAAFQWDRTRQNRLVAAGWTVLRFTWEDVTRRPQDVVRQVREALRRLGAAA